MAPVRGSKKKRKVEKKGEPEVVAYGSSEDASADWWAVLSKRVAGKVFITMLFVLQCWFFA